MASLGVPIFQAEGGLQTSGLLKLLPLLKSARHLFVLLECRSYEHWEDEGNLSVNLGVLAIELDFTPGDSLCWFCTAV